MLKKLLSAVLICAVMGMALFACAPRKTGVDNPADQTEGPAAATPKRPAEEIVFTDELPRVSAPANTHFTFTPVDGGFDVFAPVANSWGYRYAPTIFYYPDGSMDAWFATPGTNGEWDWFTYKHSDDGVTWGGEKVVLQPTADSMDHYSVCDPGLVWFNGYYYLGYTSTIVSTGGGINNNVFVARSLNADGPFEKWNGTGWGGDPAPIVYFDEEDTGWGAGEISFVELDGTLYCYYSWVCTNGRFCYVSVADSTNENWPATMEFKGRAFTNNSGDQADVVYVEDTGMFLAFFTTNRFTETSSIQLMESKDGIHFTQGEMISNNIAKYCHNMGVSKRPNGHIQLKDNLMIGYAYAAGGNGSNYWGKWPTRFQRITLTTYTGELNKTDKGNLGVHITGYEWERPENPEPIAISTTPHTVKLHLSDIENSFAVKWYDTTLRSYEIEDVSELVFSDYDASIVEFENGKLIPKSVGKTTAKVTYRGEWEIEFKVYIYEDSFEYDQETPEIVEFTPVYDEITIYSASANGARHSAQVRAFVRFADDTWGEAYNDRTASHPDYPAMVPAENYLMTFTSSDEGVVRVNGKGVLTPKSVGTAVITVTMSDGKSFTVKVNVVEPPDWTNWSDRDYK